MGEQTGLPRSKFLQAAVLGAGALVAGGSALVVEWGRKQRETWNDEIDQIAGFQGVVEPEFLEVNHEWDAERVEAVLREGVEQSQQRGVEVVVELPAGRVEIGRKMAVNVGEGQIRLIGHPEGTQLVLDEEMSQLPDAWGNHSRNLVEFSGIEGKGAVRLQNIVFDGGSVRAGKGGYNAPPSPWDAVVLCVGIGQEAIGEPHREWLGKRAGKVVVENCAFFHSESVGVVVQNVGEAQVRQCRGKYLDGLCTVNFSDRFEIQGLMAEGCLSDGIYIVDSQDGVIRDCRVRTARQGYDIHGSSRVTLERCVAYDCAQAYSVAESLASGVGSQGISLNNCDSAGSALVFALQNVRDMHVRGGRHDNVGAWYYQKDFLHTGIANPTGPRAVNRAVFTAGAMEGLQFQDVLMRQYVQLPSGYKMPRQAGIVVV